MPPDYTTETKPMALHILDDVSLAQVRTYYGKKPGYDAKSRLFNELGIPADYFSACTDGVNDLLKQYPGSTRVTTKGMFDCRNIGDFISLFSTAAGAPPPNGEPT